MKKIFLAAMFAVVSLCCNAQFVLTPSAGLMTEDGAYTILREGTESENYHAAKKAVELAIQGVDIGDLEYEKSFLASSIQKGNRRFPGGWSSCDWSILFKIKVETFDGKILISFDSVGNMEASKKGEILAVVYPTMGKNSYLNDLMGQRYIFNSKGQVGKGCQVFKDMYEEIGNSIVKEIENNLKYKATSL
ncbi:MAG: hypothetical protein IJR02_03150 [Bacteroidaceae bacterium]|nr:hypothetical protein [Bacteroidaceae bacterium]